MQFERAEKSILQNRQKTIYTTRSINNERRHIHSNKENVLSKTTKKFSRLISRAINI